MMVLSTALMVFMCTILGYMGTGLAVSPVVTFTPNWRKIFLGESISMTCDVGVTGGRDLTYVWYKDGNRVHTGQIFTIQSAKTEHSGNYNCWVGTEGSSTARLDVVFDWLILQAPLYVHEGDNLTLRCHHLPGYIGKYTTFYKYNSVIQDWKDTSELHVGSVSTSDTGRYRCKKEIQIYRYETLEDDIFIDIQELFRNPEVKVTPYPVVEGDEVTLTCSTSLSPLRRGTELKFAFYKDGQNVGEFTFFNQYGVQSAQVNDSGKYSCEVTTATYSVKKTSREILVQIKELFAKPRIIASHYPVVEGDDMTLMCVTILSLLRQGTELQFAFYRDGQSVQAFSSSDQYGVRSAQLEDSGNYACDVRTSNGNVRKTSNSIHIEIKELFFTPVLNVSTMEVLEGDNMTMTCETSLSPLRQRTELQFAFYRDGRNVQEFSLSDHFGVQSARLEDSGYYSCEVRSAANISKTSEDVFVRIFSEKSMDYTLQNIIRLSASVVVLLLGAFILFFHMKIMKVAKTKDDEDASERVEEYQSSS